MVRWWDVPLPAEMRGKDQLERVRSQLVYGRRQLSRWIRTHRKSVLQQLCRWLFRRWGGGIAIPIGAQAAGLTRQFRALHALASCDPLAC